MKLSDLKVNPDNPRTIKDARFKKLCNSVRDFPKMMALRPIVIDRENGNLILGGNMRYQALKALKFTEIPDEWVKDATELTEDEKRRFIIEDNMPFGEWDMDILANSFDTSDLVEWGFDEKELGMEKETVDAEPQIDRAEELNKKWQVKTGDLWQIGGHRLLCGDSTKKEDVGKVMREEKAALLLTDPPYGINIVRGIGIIGGAKAFGRVRQPGGNPSGIVGGKGIVEPRLYHPVIGDDKPFDPNFLMGYASVLILFGANHYASRLPDSPCWLVWDKGVSPDSTFSACELAWVNVGNHTRRYEHRWSGMVRAGNRKDEMVDRIHPTQKPVGLMTQILNDYEGDPVLDLFLGSGTTMVACQNLNRKCRGGEISPAYCSVILQRMEDAFGLIGKRI